MLNSTLIKWLSRDVPNKSSGLIARKNIALFTDIGLKRTQNQDRVACLKVGGDKHVEGGFLALVVCDGMGGMKDGAECATRAVAAFFNSLIKHRHRPEMERLRLSTFEANESVFDFSNGAGGATLSAILITEKYGTFSVNVGDSRIYAETIGNTKELHRLTIDDSLAEAVGGHGRELLQFIGMGPGIQPHISFVSNIYDRFLLTTDGIHFADSGTLSNIFINSTDINQAASRLATLARWLGAPDNASGAAISLQDAKETLTNDQHSIQILDPFSELHIAWIKEDLKRSPSKESALEESPKTTIDLIPSPENEKKSDAKFLSKENKIDPEEKPKKSRTKKKVKSTTEAPKPEDLQIVIEMDTGHKDSADDSSR
ncbi:TPA: protein phosphatase 2C domain-containing protein [Pseudomonas aeruginosa]|uniref:PP2C family protein-serine/threonine phosphatase n=1 Tax=Pseudomonas aeruginosa TaxID=287 RepID=UPI0003B986F1|nr:protein phosphatase 2C domain-containing protein [Pseudomonas aeruginosa]ELK4796922.1 protein phosphatase 2C domain-containing protein [Pseudomonas aeruginosa]ELK4828801.1 protein phosphatase 2C domain-containing protein [Pseudomonas aeruginosa]ELP2750901.1 protein phosphatase 2C domain-containing protein [Pseudomonas aeruginosa]ERU95519.1 hypothetical protein Q081_03646 [Pseudomonas aeruginosa M8A.2]ERZ48019.1 hypothetical protein Q082_01751 [Pseudomonas aeruginosa M8A.3]